MLPAHELPLIHASASKACSDQAFQTLLSTGSKCLSAYGLRFHFPTTFQNVFLSEHNLWHPTVAWWWGSRINIGILTCIITHVRIILSYWMRAMCQNCWLWHTFCTFIQDVRGRYKIVKKGYKVEILSGRETRFKRIRGNMKIWRQHEKMETTWPKGNQLVDNYMDQWGHTIDVIASQKVAFAWTCCLDL